MEKIIAITITSAFLQFLGCTCIQAQPIGTVATNEPLLRGTQPGQATRNLSIGARVVSNEIIASSPNGRGQILFADQSTLSIGPNTQITLDKFIYDPTGNQGNFGMKLAQGTLRFIGGAISDQAPATVDTPTATIGIRGSTALINFRNGQTTAIFIAGDEMCLTPIATGQKTCTSRQGGVLGENGYLGKATSTMLADFLDSIDGPPGRLVGGFQNITNIRNRNLADRGPVSTSGKEFETNLFEENSILEDLSESITDTQDNSVITNIFRDRDENSVATETVGEQNPVFNEGVVEQPLPLQPEDINGFSFEALSEDNLLVEFTSPDGSTTEIVVEEPGAGFEEGLQGDFTFQDNGDLAGGTINVNDIQFDVLVAPDGEVQLDSAITTEGVSLPNAE